MHVAALSTSQCLPMLSALLSSCQEFSAQTRHLRPAASLSSHRSHDWSCWFQDGSGMTVLFEQRGTGAIIRTPGWTWATCWSVSLLLGRIVSKLEAWHLLKHMRQCLYCVDAKRPSDAFALLKMLTTSGNLRWRLKTYCSGQYWRWRCFGNLAWHPASINWCKRRPQRNWCKPDARS